MNRLPILPTASLLVSVFVLTGLLPACTEEDGGASGASQDGTTPAPGCDSLRGPAMARVELDIDTFCIDRTEVTRAQYSAYVSEGAPTPPAVPEVCRAGGSHVPNPKCSAADELCQGEDCGAFPQTCVSYCDAAAFCAWAGKELCGVIGGGYGVRHVADPRTARNAGRWTAACSNGFRADGAPKVPYSSSGRYTPSTCNTETGRVLPVGSTPSCTLWQDPTVVDMIGNVAELSGVLHEINETSKIVVPRAYGGSASKVLSSDEIKCESAEGLRNLEDTDASVGFRCCKNVD